MLLLILEASIVCVLRKKLNAAKPPEQSKCLGGNIGCKDKKSSTHIYIHGTKRVPQCLKINQNAPRPSEHLPVRGGEMSKRLGGMKGCKYKTSSMAFKRLPQWK